MHLPRLLTQRVAMPLCIVIATLSTIRPAYAERPIAVAYDQILVGGIAHTANTIVTCDRAKESAQLCDRIEASDGPIIDSNNALYTRWVDIDEDASTYNSSAGTLTLPTDARVEWATLYWVGTDWTTQQNHIMTQEATTPQDMIKLKPPGQTAYTELKADWCDLSDHHLTCARQVTELIAQYGPGQYTIANLATNMGFDDFFGGWELKVAYRTLQDQPPRHLLIAHGSVKYGATPAQLTIQGALLPSQGPLQGALTLSTAEGDARQLDRATYEMQPLGLSLSPADDLGNGSICDERGNITARSPANVNTLGLDQDTFNIGPLLTPDTTEATVTLDAPANGESNTWFAIAYEADTAAPKLRHELSVSPSAQTIQAESEVTLEATITAAAQAPDQATSLNWELIIPAGLAYVPGTLTLTQGDVIQPLSDASDEDAGAFDPDNRRLQVIWDDQAQLMPGSQATLSARFIIEPLDAPAHIEAQAQLSYQGQALLAQGITRTITQPSHATSPQRAWTTNIDALPAPKLTIESPTADQRVSATTLIVTGSGPSDQALELALDGEVIEASKSDAQGKFSLELEGLSQGAHTVSIKTRYQVASTSFVVEDEQAPLFVTITEPADDQSLPQRFVIRGLSTPGAIVEAFISGESLAGSSVGQDGQWAIVAQGIPAARHTLGVTASHKGQTISAPILTIYVEAQAPSPSPSSTQGCAQAQPLSSPDATMTLMLLLSGFAFNRRRRRRA